MNTQELRENRSKELKALWQKFDETDEEAIFQKIQEVEERYRILIHQQAVVEDWGFCSEEWDTLSQGAKAIILDMAAEANRYQQLREELQGWLEQAP